MTAYQAVHKLDEFDIQEVINIDNNALVIHFIPECEKAGMIPHPPDGNNGNEESKKMH